MLCLVTDSRVDSPGAMLVVDKSERALQGPFLPCSDSGFAGLSWVGGSP